MPNPHYSHTATLLPQGKVLIAGGWLDNSGDITPNAELYDPATSTWISTTPMNVARTDHTATLLANGRVLLAAGAGSGPPGALTSGELYDPGLGFDSYWQPQIATATSPLGPGDVLTLGGAQFQGVSEGSGGNNSQNSPSDCPVVQLRSIATDQTLFLLTTNWSTNSFISQPVSGLPLGWTLATAFVNGIPSASAILLIAPEPTTILLMNATMLPGGAFQFGFTNTPGAFFNALATTNLSLPLSQWTALGGVTEISDGQFQFTDSQATNHTQRFYRVRSP